LRPRRFLSVVRPGDPDRMMRKPFAILLRVALTMAIFWWLSSRIDFREVWHFVGEADPRWMGMSLLLSIGQRVCRSLNWGQLLRALGVATPMLQWNALRVYFAAGFLGALFPSSVTADALRILLAKRLFGENLSGLAATALLLNACTWGAACSVGLAGLAFLVVQGALPAVLSGAMVFLLAITMGFAAIYMILRLNRGRAFLWMRRWSASLFPLRRFLRELVSGLLLFEKNRGNVWLVLPVALAAQTLGVLSLATLGSGIGLDLPLGAFLVAVPLSAVVSIIPASILGFGAMQAFHVLYFTEFGAGQSQALAVSTLYTMMSIGTHLAFGACVLLFTDLAKTEAPPASRAQGSRS